MFLNIYSLKTQIIKNLTHLFVAIFLSILLKEILIAFKLYNHMPKVFLGIFIICSALVEIISRIKNKNTNYYIINLISFLTFLLRKIKNKLFRIQNLNWLYFFITITYFYLCYPYFIEGLKSIDQLKTPTSLIGLSFTSVLTIFAILLTISGLVIRNIQKYSVLFLKHFLLNKVFLWIIVYTWSYLLILSSFIYFGTNEQFEAISYYSLVYFIISILYISFHFINFINPSNLASILSIQAKNIVKKIKKAPFIDRDAPIETNKLHSIFQWIQIWIIGKYDPVESFKQSMPLDVDKNIVNQLNTSVEPIFEVMRKSLIDDKRDIFRCCLAAIEEITSKYLKRRQNYQGMNDSYLGHIVSQFNMVQNQIIQHPQQDYNMLLVGTIHNIGANCLISTKTQLRRNENGLVYSWVKFQKDTVYKCIHLKHTSAPSDAIKSIYDLGCLLISNKAFTTAIYHNANSLREIGVMLGKIPGVWPGVLCQNSIFGLTRMLIALINSAKESGWIDDINFSKVLEDMEDILKSVNSVEIDSYSYQTIVAPLVGSLWCDGNLADIFAHMLNTGFGNNRLYNSFLHNAISISSTLRRISSSRIEKGYAYSYEFFLVFSEIIYTTIIHNNKLQEKINDLDTKQLESEGYLPILENSKKLLKTVVKDSLYTLSWHDPNSQNGYKYLFKISPVFAFLVYFSKKYPSEAIILAKDEFITQFCDLYKKFKERTKEYPHFIRSMYSYLKMFGAWYYKQKPDSTLTKNIIELLVADYVEEKYTGFSIRPSRSRMEELGYPTELISDSWYVYPSDYWPQDQWLVTNELNDMDNYESFHNLIVSKLAK
jgi:hypothetical protein